MTSPAASSRSVVIEASNIWKAFDHGRIQVLQGAGLTVHRGETIALCGASGSGKSTLLNIIGGLDAPDEGEVRIHGRIPRTTEDRTRLRRETVGFVFQLHNLIPDLTLVENCLVPALAAGARPRDRLERIHHLLEATGIRHRADRPVQELSGGERQRAAICRALVNEPSIILADEPTGSLDEASGRQVLDLLFDLVARDAATLVMATHDRAVAERCDRIVVMRDGRTL